MPRSLATTVQPAPKACRTCGGAVRVNGRWDDYGHLDPADARRCINIRTAA